MENEIGILAVDPGETTGLYWWKGAVTQGVLPGDVLCGGVGEGWEIGGKCADDALGRFLAESALAELVCDVVGDRAADWLVMEDFVLRPGRHNGDRSGFSSPRVAWLMLASLLVRGYPELGSWVKFQQPAQMAVIKDEQLKRWGMWTVGSEHARDAARHLAVFVRGMCNSV